MGIINDTTKELRVTQKSRDASLRATRRFLGGEPALKVSSPSGGAMSPLQLAVSVRRATAQDSER